MNRSLRKPRIGILINEIDGFFNVPVIAGFRAKAEEHGLKLLFLPVRIIDAESAFERQYNQLLNFADTPHIDGLVSVTSSFMSAGSHDATLAALARCAHIPMVSIGLRLPWAPTIVPDNATGFRALINHLIADHGYNRIAFMRGRESNPDAIARFEVFQECMHAAGLAIDESLVVDGQFDHYHGRIAMETLLERRIPFDALVAANDEMALASMSVAAERGLRIPEDLAVVGFDDLLSLHHSGPPLSTVRQPMQEQAELAIEVLLARLRGETVSETYTVPTRLVLRQTCGCLGERSAPAGTSTLAVSRDGETVPIADLLNAAAVQDEQRSAYRNHLARLNATLFEDDAKAFEDCVSEVAANCLTQYGDLSPLQALLFVMHRRLFEEGTLSRQELQRFGERLQHGQILISNAYALDQVRITFASKFSDTQFIGQLRARVSSFELEQTLNLIEGAIARLGLRSCHVGLYDSPVSFGDIRHSEPPASAHLIFSVVDGARQNSGSAPSFPATHLVPGELFHGSDFEVMGLFPVCQLNHHFGYLALDITSPPTTRLETIIEEISATLCGALVAAELARARDLLRNDLENASLNNRRLADLAERDELTGLYNRRGFFNQARSVMTSDEGRPLIVFFADLDRLKYINDTFGHKEGDFAIRMAAQILAKAFRTGDIVSRMGGDEFVILGVECPTFAMERIRNRIYKMFDTFNACSGKPYPLGCSIGFYEIPENAATLLETVISQADAYLYEEKARRKALRGAEAGETRTTDRRHPPHR
ncbi:diguanylate cyclase domain-containing protein [Niveibacterium umoris]|uniref:diguanylate cyclase domain-containing protein n=1 Tax=Niveibacterium umoris TaxID=1193620 RepID=UPI00161EDB56